jgi:ATP-dependent helicase/nuclease subunit A
MLRAMSGFTGDQRRAITTPGNVLVMAGAGTGKTRTLVERCLARVLAESDPVSLDEVLMVTFTEAAAAEMRKRIRERLEEAAQAAPTDTRPLEQIALLDAARISTLHGFCLQLVREHFHELEVDPQVAVLDPAQAELVAAESLEALLLRHYAGGASGDAAVRELILAHGGGRDETVRHLVRRLHEYTQTLPDAAGWFTDQLALAAQPEPAHWQAWLFGGVEAWRGEWLKLLSEVDAGNLNAWKCAEALRAMVLEGAADAGAQARIVAEALGRVLEADAAWPQGKKQVFRAPLEKLFADAAFLLSLVRVPAGGGGASPRDKAGPPPGPGVPVLPALREDWDLVRPHLTALLELAREFTLEFARAKRELGAVDFHDLEQFALRLLWDRQAECPSRVALSWRQRLRLVLVDEYQDINAAQDRIIVALSRDGAEGNRFLVGDVKQSIYRFRLANPRIFQEYASRWGAQPAAGQLIPLADNFRSHEGVLNCVNAIFSVLMRAEVGGVAYDAAAALRFGDAERRPHHATGSAASPATGAPGAPPVELQLRLTSRAGKRAGDGDQAEPGEGDFVGDSNTEKEARWAGQRLRELKQQPLLVWDRAREAHRPVTWSDMVILLRSPRAKAESYAKVFEQLGVPLVAGRRGLYEALEVSDLLSLLKLLDNPLQDIPTLAVLRSPLAGFTANELAVIRLGQPKGSFWTALQGFHQRGPPPAASAGGGQAERPELDAPRASAWGKAHTLLERYQRWRELARRGSLSQCLETVLDETHYEDWLLAQDRGGQRRANVTRLLQMTRQFDQFQRQGLFRFLKFAEAQQAAELDPEPAAVEAEEAVRLMSIHQAKGLEFPVVVLADLGKPFNFDDLRGNVLLDETHGPCLLVKPSWTAQNYPCLPYWLAARRQRRELLGEELRLLYVAMTRACDRLILSASVTRSATEKRWGAGLPAAQLLGARSYMDWLGPLLGRVNGAPEWLHQPSGQGRLLSWRIQEADAARVPAGAPQPGPADAPAPALEVLAALRQRLTWRYPHQAATVQAAKTSVSALRRQVAEETDDEAHPMFRHRGRQAPGPRPPGRLSAAEVGKAHHRFLQFFAWEHAGSEARLAAEAERLTGIGVLTREEADVLDLGALAAFWGSELGRRVRDQAGWTRRELEFTARLGAADFAALGVPVVEGLGGAEFVIVQGVVDLAVIRPDEIWVVDFKTDQVTEADVPDRVRAYSPQLALYALALERIYTRPVTGKWLHFFAPGKSVEILGPRVAPP